MPSVDGLDHMAAKSPYPTSPEVSWKNGLIPQSIHTDHTQTGYFAGTVGVRRLLKLFEKYNIKTTWFIPGHSLETFPEECAMIRDAGHEIGLHGYSHENPRDMTIEQQEIVLDKTYRLISEFCGKPPRGSVVPWWETSKEGADLMLKYGTEFCGNSPVF